MIKIRRNTLSFRIITRVLLITITLFIIILSVYYYQTRKIIIESTRTNAIELAGNITGKIENVLQPIEKVPQMLSTSLEIGAFTRDSLILVLKTILSKNPTIFGASIAFEPDYFPDKGRYFMPYVYRHGDTIKGIYLGDENYDYFYMDWYQIPTFFKEASWSEPYFDEGAGNVLMATYSVPFYCKKNRERHFAGIITVDLELEWLSGIVSEVKIYETGYTFLLSGNGVAVTHPDKKQIMNKSIYSNAIEWNAPAMREIGRDLAKGVRQFRDYNIPGRQKQWIYYRNLQSNKWSIGVVYPDREIFAPLRNITTLLIVLFIAGLILLILLISGIINQLAAPLTLFSRSARTIAEGNFNATIPPVKTNDEMLELHQAFTHMQHQLAEYVENLKETTSAKEKIESELRIAREIQMAMIPHTFPPFPDLLQISLFARLKSAKEVGGDLYDFFNIDKYKFCFAIGDVSGKGVPASLFMAVTRTLLRSISDKEKSASTIVGNLNKSLAFNNESNMFVTFFLGILDLETGWLHYSNAGHNPPVLISHEGKVTMFKTANAIPLGLFDDFNYTESKIRLSRGDMIFTYTDGVTEAENEKSELFGEEQMLRVIKKVDHPEPNTLIEKMGAAIEEHVKGFLQSDDITMMTIKYNA